MADGLRELAWAMKDTRKQLSGLAQSVGHGLEAYAMERIPKVLAKQMPFLEETSGHDLHAAAPRGTISHSSLLTGVFPMRFRPRIESLESRLALVGNVFTVSTLADSGAGSLRQAILDANAEAGFDLIDFTVAGVIRVGATALPTVTDGVIIAGNSAPGYAGKPVVRIDFQNTSGLTLAAGSEFSRITALSLVDAAAAGVTVGASHAELSGNFIGVWGNGVTIEPNRGDGVLVQDGVSDTQIGTGNPETSVVSNVISGNFGNGITIYGDDSVVAANTIGADVSGTIPLGNRGHGIRITAGATGNLVGGVAIGGNDPTNGVFIRPPEGNLISANRGCGVRIDSAATGNQLSGNFIGTSASGNKALGNWKDGVAIVDADGNSLTGTTAVKNPFVYYNVLSGNVGNGLRITNSDRTIVHANFFGLGANNATRVPNGRSGMLVNGDSWGVDAGGEIPLGNVMSGNALYGIEIRDTASGVVSFNNFVGQVAFGGAAPNGASGIVVTSSNPRFSPADSSTWNRIRTCLIGGNLGNGVEFLGNAYGAEITDTAVGTNDGITAALPNLGNGIVVGGKASQIAIGGFQPSIEQADGGFSVHVGGNKGFGIVVQESAHDVFVFNTRVGLGVGTTIDTAYKLPNAAGGVFVGPGTSNVTIGGVPDLENPLVRYADEIVGNKGNGLTVVSSKNLVLLGCTISGNTASGVVLNGAQGATIGAPMAANIVTRNRAFGLYATGSMSGTSVQSSAFSQNALSGVRLVAARGITFGGDDLLANVITGNKLWGIFASGWCKGTAFQENVVRDNSPGNVNTKGATGIQQPRWPA
jgi:parallel beta-helix repeat protein